MYAYAPPPEIGTSRRTCRARRRSRSGGAFDIALGRSSRSGRPLVDRACRSRGLGVDQDRRSSERIDFHARGRMGRGNCGGSRSPCRFDRDFGAFHGQVLPDPLVLGRLSSAKGEGRQIEKGELVFRVYPVMNLGTTTIEESMTAYEKTITRLETLAKQLPEGPRVAALKKVEECWELVRGMKEIPEAVLPDAEKTVDQCIEEVKKAIDIGIAAQQQTSAEPKGVPTLAYIGGGAVIAGIAALFFM
jgi:hypothetical protein